MGGALTTMFEGVAGNTGRTLRTVAEVRAAIAKPGGVAVFTGSFCPYCSQALGALTAARIEHQVFNAPKSVLYELTGKTSVPQAFVHGVHIGGCNDGPQAWMGIVPNIDNGKIAQALATDDAGVFGQ